MLGREFKPLECSAWIFGDTFCSFAALEEFEGVLGVVSFLLASENFMSGARGWYLGDCPFLASLNIGS